MVDRDEAEMNGVVQAAGTVMSGTLYLDKKTQSREQLYEFMGKLSDSFSTLSSDVFFVSVDYFIVLFFGRFVQLSLFFEKIQDYCHLRPFCTLIACNKYKIVCQQLK